jgi:hypothetical protein
MIIGQRGKPKVDCSTDIDNILVVVGHHVAEETIDDWHPRFKVVINRGVANLGTVGAQSGDRWVLVAEVAHGVVNVDRTTGVGEVGHGGTANDRVRAEPHGCRNACKNLDCRGVFEIGWDKMWTDTVRKLVRGDCQRWRRRVRRVIGFARAGSGGGNHSVEQIGLGRQSVGRGVDAVRKVGGRKRSAGRTEVVGGAVTKLNVGMKMAT